MIDNTKKEIVLAALYSVAPDLEGEAIDPDAGLREQFELDSMDMLNFVVALHDATGIDIPEARYPELETVNGCVRFLQQQQPSS